MKKLLSKIKMIGAILCFIPLVLLSSCGLWRKEIHGEELLKLNDNELYERVYLQNLDFVESFDDEETAMSQMSPECRTVYILSIFDMEIQNGGLCQFFVNSSNSFAPYVDECLGIVNAQEHRELFAEFVANNNIDLENLDSFETDDVDEYIEQTKRYDFDSFDDRYSQLIPLQDYLVSYIKANISKF